MSVGNNTKMSYPFAQKMHLYLADANYTQFSSQKSTTNKVNRRRYVDFIESKIPFYVMVTLQRYARARSTLS